MIAARIRHPGWILLIALVLLTALRLLVAARSPLSTDEAYYWVWSHALAAGYYDHPPMTALWIHTGTLVFGDTKLGVRLLAPIAALLGSLLLALAASDLLGGTGEEKRNRALLAPVLLNCTLMLGAGAVTMTPDTPLLFFWTAALAALGRMLATGWGGWWVGVGIAIGLALDSKYTVVLPGAGLALWLIATPVGRSWLRTPWPWAAALIALALFAPVLQWNAAHGWASLVKQGGRSTAWHPALAGRYLAELVGAQAGLATPLLFVMFVLGIARLSRRPIGGAPGHCLLVFVTLVPCLVFVEHALGDRVQANWPSLLYPSSAIAAGLLSIRVARPAACFGLLLTGMLYLQSTAAPFSLPGKLDITLTRLAGWQGLAAQFAAIGRGPLLADDYGLAAELAFALPGRAVVAIEPRWRLFGLPHPDLGAQSVLLLHPARRREGPDLALFTKATLLGEILRQRNGRVAEQYRIYRVTIRSPLAANAQKQFARLPSPAH